MNHLKTLLFPTIFLFFFTQARGQGEIYQIGDNNDFCAGDLFGTVEGYKARQFSDNWCWAACIQMVLKKQGLFVDQCDIVINGFEQDECNDRPADCYVIKKAASGWDINGRSIEAWVDQDFNADGMIDDLAYHYPLIIGLNMPGQNIGHAYVLTAIYFSYNSRNQKVPYKVVLRDPWPENPSRLELSWSNFYNRINCVTHVTF